MVVAQLEETRTNKKEVEKRKKEIHVTKESCIVLDRFIFVVLSVETTYSMSLSGNVVEQNEKVT